MLFVLINYGHYFSQLLSANMTCVFGATSFLIELTTDATFIIYVFG